MAIERLVPGTIEWEAFYANHICRYEFAKEQLDRMSAVNILDAACGVGYGCFFLGANDRLRITAVDKSSRALEVANKNFKRPNINYMEDDCHTLINAARSGPYDCIVSFETLEHLPHPELFIKSCSANLSTGGKLIISTPNQLVSSPDGKLDWEYHEKEYEPSGFLKILLGGSDFSSVDLFGQQTTPIGKLRAQIRSELNKLSSNPFMRVGRQIQRMIRGHRYAAVLPEQAEDFEINRFADPDQIIKAGANGPFVLVAVCNK